jgi:hypothetical protein
MQDKMYRKLPETVPTAEAQIRTESASAYLAELCRQLDERATTRGDVRVRIEWSESDGVVDFGWGRCAIHADPNALSLRVEANDQETVESLQELFTRHLQHIAPDAELEVSWHQSEAPTTEPAPHARRDRMRHFHRQVRHSPDSH